ncbi:hypothetical protein MC885_008008, partial [Smutsia gigantea]
RKKPNLRKTSRWDAASRLPGCPKHTSSVLQAESAAQSRGILGSPSSLIPSAPSRPPGEEPEPRALQPEAAAPPRVGAQTLPGVLGEPPVTNTAEVSLWSLKASPGVLGACRMGSSPAAAPANPAHSGSYCQIDPARKAGRGVLLPILAP